MRYTFILFAFVLFASGFYQLPILELLTLFTLLVGPELPRFLIAVIRFVALNVLLHRLTVENNLAVAFYTPPLVISKFLAALNVLLEWTLPMLSW